MEGFLKTEAAIKYGASSQELWDEITVAYARRKEAHRAMVAVAFGEVVASKPYETKGDLVTEVLDFRYCFPYGLGTGTS